MINFIVVDDVVEIASKVEEIIGKAMMHNKLEYRIHVFHDYDKKFMNFISKPMANKVYFLDIEAKGSISGIDVARMIRKTDIHSVISFITAHDELGGVVAKQQLMILTFICKFDGFEDKIVKAVLKALEILDANTMIRFNDYNALYTIPLRDIVYITRDSVERKCLIKTDYTVYKVNKNLSELKEMGGGALVQSHRACLVNKARIRKTDWKNGKIFFNNDDSIDMLSPNYKKELV